MSGMEGRPKRRKRMPLAPTPDQLLQQPRLLDQVRNVLRTKHYSYSTEKTYIYWIRQFIFFHNKQHPDLLNEEHINAYLSHLAVKEHVSASTQNQALCAIVFLYKQVLHR